MEHIWITINDLGVFLVMILVGAVVWLVSRSLLFKIFESSRLVESISIVLALSVGAMATSIFVSIYGPLSTNVDSSKGSFRQGGQGCKHIIACRPQHAHRGA